MTEFMQMRGLWHAHLFITQGVAGDRRETADRAILAGVHHGVTPVVRAFAERLRSQHGIVAPGFIVETGGAA